MTILEIVGIPYFKKGSGIHIKKKNRGKFTEYCGGKVTDECIQKAKKSKNPTLRKRATFAQNARGWAKKHQEGGEFNPPKISLTEEQKAFLKANPDEYYKVMPVLARQNQRDYAKAWYAERFKQDKYKPQLVGNMEKINKILSTDGYVSYDDPRIRDKRFTDNNLPVDAFFMPANQSSDGKAFWSGKTKAHQWHEGIGHWLGDQIPGLLSKYPTTQLRYTGPFPNDTYEAQINRQNENHAQTWEFRGLNKDMKDSKGKLYIDPNRQLSPADVQDMLDKGARLPQGWQNTNITTEGIADFHNTFADNNIKKSNGTMLV